MRRQIQFAPLLLSLLLFGCATKVTQHQGVKAAVSVHAVLAAVDDAELALFQAKAITPEVHARANVHIVTALKAGKAFDASIRAWPADGAVTKVNLQDITYALGALAAEVVTFGSPEVQAKLQSILITAQQTVLAVVALLL